MFSVESWFEGFWAMYDAKLCGGGPQKGSKSMALKSALKRVKDEDTAKRVLMALAAQKKYFHDCQRNNTFHAKFPHAVTWLNQERWEIEIDSHAELKEKASAKQCKCGKPVQVNYQGGGKCIDCHNDYYKDHDWRYHACRQKFVEMGLKKQEGESKQQHIDRVRGIGQALMNSLRR